jgi:hypothetical protein
MDLANPKIQPNQTIPKIKLSEMLIRSKHSSLFVMNLSDKEKSFITSTPDWVLTCSPFQQNTLAGKE